MCRPSDVLVLDPIHPGHSQREAQHFNLRFHLLCLLPSFPSVPLPPSRTVGPCTVFSTFIPILDNAWEKGLPINICFFFYFFFQILQTAWLVPSTDPFLPSLKGVKVLFVIPHSWFFVPFSISLMESEGSKAAAFFNWRMGFQRPVLTLQQ